MTMKGKSTRGVKEWRPVYVRFKLTHFLLIAFTLLDLSIRFIIDFIISFFCWVRHQYYVTIIFDLTICTLNS